MKPSFQDKIRRPIGKAIYSGFISQPRKRSNDRPDTVSPSVWPIPFGAGKHIKKILQPRGAGAV
ncbi:MAG: hypothetical protein A2V45_15195 [Candidatus Aminicenantes bacterium RBG_19FT_COMBO_58_17]|nr:MAG: hypothetical protein A2V45_15195 [Candidatus Aminicenantes bacterium RBG_19FT_COMBO_58_17]HCS48835.1 hypothetical protein [Candidatus Aminicenantes bacterium]